MVSEDTKRVAHSVCFDLYPPTNPAVLFAAAREWYLAYGADAVMRQFIGWLSELEKIQSLDCDLYQQARNEYQAKCQRPSVEVSL